MLGISGDGAVPVLDEVAVAVAVDVLVLVGRAVGVPGIPTHTSYPTHRLPQSEPTAGFQA